MRIHSILGLTLLLVMLVGVCPARAQRPDTTRVYVYPQVLYPGDNIVTVSSANGLSSITSSHTANVTIDGDGAVDDCAKEQTLRVYMGTASDTVRLNLTVTDCKGKTHILPQLRENTVWSLDYQRFPDAEVGETVCTPFQIRSTGIAGLGPQINLDSVTIPDSRAYARFPFPPPLSIPIGGSLSYQVCFKGDKPGVYTFPVITWIQRDLPYGGYTNYPVADTGIIRVVPKRNNSEDPIAEIPPDTVGVDNPPEPEPELVDPTTFRSVAIPNAIVPRKGKFFIGSYDLLGLVAGYSFSDQIMILAGGAVPTPDDWAGIHGDIFGAFSVGIKAGGAITDNLNMAVGYQFGKSILDKDITPDEVESEIVIHAPYASISYGDDDSRISTTFGYAFKHHSTWVIGAEFGVDDFRDLYNRNAGFVSIGGDYRFAKHWKVAAEVVAMETVDIIPVVLTGRYFSDWFAIDVGAAYAGIVANGAEQPSFPLLPVVSGVFVF